MTTDLTILTEKIDNALLVTQRAVLEKNNGIKYVRLSQGESFTEQEVVVGQKGDGGFWQIISGLEEGEKVVVSVREL
jgi:multidrug efflux pump subunit AcrA (membrane-fusion protein)